MRVRLSVFLSVCACVCLCVSVRLSVSVVLVCVSTSEGGGVSERFDFCLSLAAVPWMCLCFGGVQNGDYFFCWN